MYLESSLPFWRKLMTKVDESVGKWKVVGGSVVGGFNKTQKNKRNLISRKNILLFYYTNIFLFDT